MLTYGVQDHAIDPGRAGAGHDSARTVVDCFRYRNKIGIDVAMEALRDAVHSRKALIGEIDRAAEVCRISTVIAPYLEAHIACVNGRETTGASSRSGDGCRTNFARGVKTWSSGYNGTRSSDSCTGLASQVTASSFVLKGATLFAIWGTAYRPTRDIDFTGLRQPRSAGCDGCLPRDLQYPRRR